MRVGIAVPTKFVPKKPGSVKLNSGCDIFFSFFFLFGRKLVDNIYCYLDSGYNARDDAGNMDQGLIDFCRLLRGS